MEVDTLRMSCPYCKNTSVYTVSWDGGWFDVCQNCGAVTSYPSDTPEQSRKLWNMGEIITNEDFLKTQRILEPCPFCGAKPLYADADDYYHVIPHEDDCFFCFDNYLHNTTIFKDNDAAIDAWNRRVEQ